MRLPIRKWVILFICLVFQNKGRALAGDLEWRGFFTTGAAWTDADQLYSAAGISKKTKISEETYLGLNLSKDLEKDWRVAAQLVARGSQHDSALKADWAFVSFDPPEPYDVTLGKQKIPIWMMAAYLDVGRAYPWVNPPEEVYTLFPLKSFTGISVGYSLAIGESFLSFKPYAGDATFEVNPRSPAAKTQVDGTNMFGGALELSWNKLLLRTAYNQATWDLNIDANVQFGERHFQMVAHGLRLDHEGFLLYMEYATTLDLDEHERMKLADQWTAEAAIAAAAGDSATATRLGALAAQNRNRIGGSKAYYATIGQQMQSFLLHLTYASLNKPSGNPTDGDQNSVALGLNYDINVDSVIKLEAKLVTLPNDTSQGLFARRPDDDKAMVYHLGYCMIF